MVHYQLSGAQLPPSPPSPRLPSPHPPAPSDAFTATPTGDVVTFVSDGASDSLVMPLGLKAPPLAAADARLAERGWHPAAKRGLDVVMAALLLALLLPLLLAVAVAVRLTSPGPVLYSQQRWGRGQRLFTCYKFRSMVARPDAALAREIARRQTDGVLAKGARDPRVTRVGALIRRTSIDELPQLWNVLRGDMSVVGPRALMVHMLEPYPAFRALRCTVRPGITGLWQVRDRARNDHVRFMVAHDTEYILGFSFWLDLRILLATVRVVLSGEGAV